MSAPVRFHFDLISPYAYLAWTQVRGLCARYGRSVEPVPTLFAALLNHHGHKGPAEIPPKRTYIFKDCLRHARRLGVPLEPPPSHPFNPLLALRAASVDLDPAARESLVDALYRETWATGRGVTEASVVAEAARSVGLDGDSVVAQASSPEVKERVRRQTEDAIRAGVFGVPTCFVDGEMYWGLDALPFVEARLRGEDPIDDKGLQRWAHIAPSSVRTPRPPSSSG